MNNLIQYNLYGKYGNFLITGSVYELVNFILDNDNRFRKDSLSSSCRIENNLRTATKRKFKPYGYIIKRIWKENEKPNWFYKKEE